MSDPKPWPADAHWEHAQEVACWEREVAYLVDEEHHVQFSPSEDVDAFLARFRGRLVQHQASLAYARHRLAQAQGEQDRPRRRRRRLIIGLRYRGWPSGL
jgi:hypothetical protein